MFKKVIEKLNNAKRVGIFTHVNPDGDALGSTHSLKLVLEGMGKLADVFCTGEAEPCLFEVVQGVAEVTGSSMEYDLLVALDCASADRMGEWTELFENHPNTVAIDHHITHVEFAKETVVGDISSTCELMFSLYKEMGVTLTLQTATNLYIGIATDTGNFKFSSVTGDTHRVAAELIDLGIDFANVSKVLFDTVSKEFLALRSKAAAKIKFYLENRVAILALEEEDFAQSGVSEAEASALVSLPSRILGVEVGVYIRPRFEEGYKVSLRSVKRVDVAEIAAGFGGGGHIRAAGYSVSRDNFDDNLNTLLEEIEKRL